MQLSSPYLSSTQFNSATLTFSIILCRLGHCSIRQAIRLSVITSYTPFPFATLTHSAIALSSAAKLFLFLPSHFTPFLPRRDHHHWRRPTTCKPSSPSHGALGECLELLMKQDQVPSTLLSSGLLKFVEPERKDWEFSRNSILPLQDNV